jgi:pyruvate formate lyase activating enzyme
MKEALFWKSEDRNKVRCNLCCHRCLVAPGKRGICGVRENRSGVLYSLVYGAATAQKVDPIEKKPLYHFLPGTRTFSFSTKGCNFRCLHCQNCDISQVGADETFTGDIHIMPDRIVETAKELRCRSIAYTYTEPTIYFEYALDTARIAVENGLRNVFVTNGYMTPEALRHASSFIDAANIDLKFFSDGLYKKVCGGRLQPVLDSIKLFYELGVWIEITTLVIPAYNDSEGHLRSIAGFIAGLNPCIPWHVSAFYPTHEMTGVPPTPHATLKRALEAGLAEGLQFVYPGNIGGRVDTVCPECREVLVERTGFEIPVSRVRRGRCPACSAAVAGVWE